MSHMFVSGLLEEGKVCVCVGILLQLFILKVFRLC